MPVAGRFRARCTVRESDNAARVIGRLCLAYFAPWLVFGLILHAPGYCISLAARKTD
ncbi:hypothetical protein BN2476_210019 [Paraburkholderia piptadeniae]|uniref:Uncharacterized protein n=1 Tax=Paraburkholderia piptadeniae TaxID=1701573 RepID=A0A1N7RVD5_9BURK|nr:hypothetical protein BN2476_210019 [Paraburkholderia piptadeniae]